MTKIISICKDGVRYDIPLKDYSKIGMGNSGGERGVSSLSKQEPIAEDKPVISRGAIVTLKGHKGKVLDTEGDEATVSWEDASISKVPIASLQYVGRVEKGGPGSGRHPEGGETRAESKAGYDRFKKPGDKPYPKNVGEAKQRRWIVGNDPKLGGSSASRAGRVAGARFGDAGGFVPNKARGK